MDLELQYLLRKAMHEAKASADWAKIEGRRSVLEAQYKFQYERAGKFLRFIMRHTTPKSLFIPIPPPNKP